MRTPDELVAAGLVEAGAATALTAVAARYAVAVPPALAALIDPADPADPIARQVLPDVRELQVAPEERADPIGDDAHSPCDGIVHRYPDRVLLKLLSVCPLYCRFCFRRERVGPGGDAPLSATALATALDYIAARPDIWEVILTGGDPLAASPRRLAGVADRLAAMEHVKILRVHSRVPVAAPDRITPSLLDALTRSGKSLHVAVHANHPREITGTVRAALDRLHRAGAVLHSQTVLLRGVNDDPDTLAALMRAFVEARVTPYYLHHPDLAPGTGHFRLTVAEGQEIVRALRGRISGLCQPRYVLDIPGGHGKSPIEPSYLVADPFGALEVTDWRGNRHAYPPLTQPQAGSPDANAATSF